MSEEKYKILWDLEQIKNILDKKELESGRTRVELVRLLCDMQFFKSDVGECFLEFIVSEDFCLDDRKTILKECTYFQEVLQRCKTKYPHNRKQYSEMGQRIARCIYKYLESEVQNLYRKKKGQHS